MENRYKRRMEMEDDGTLGCAVFRALRKRFADEDRARDMMGAMSALGMIYFESIEAATEELVQRDLRIGREEAAWVVDACDKAVAELEKRPEKHPTVLVAQTGKAQAQLTWLLKIVKKNDTAPAKQALARESTLREALVAENPKRKPKPRKSGMVNEELWSGSMGTIIERLSSTHRITDLHLYYSSMCPLGKSLLVAEIHKETQGLYNCRVSKLEYRANRRKA